MSDEEIKRKQEILEALKRRKHEREKQAAMFGVSADPIITVEIEELSKKIKQFEQDIVDIKKPTKPTTRRIVIITSLTIAITLLVIVFTTTSKIISSSVEPTPFILSALYANTNSSDMITLKRTKDIIEVKQLLIGKSEKQYQLEIVLNNKLQQNILIKRLSVIAIQPSDRRECNNVVSGEIPATFIFSDTVTVDTFNANSVFFRGYFSQKDKLGYLYGVNGKIVSGDKCVGGSVEFEFDASLVLSANEYKFIDLIMPRTIRSIYDNPLVDSEEVIISDFLEDKNRVDYNEVTIKVWTDLQNDPISTKFPKRNIGL